MKRLSFALRLFPELFEVEDVLGAGEADGVYAGIAPLVCGLVGCEYPRPICAEALPTRQTKARPTAPTLYRFIIVIIFVISIKDWFLPVCLGIGDSHLRCHLDVVIPRAVGYAGGALSRYELSTRSATSL